MESCILVFVIIGGVVLVVFGLQFLALLEAILQVIYPLSLDSANWVKRIFWSQSLDKLPYFELKRTSEEFAAHLVKLKGISKELSAVPKSEDKTESFLQMLRCEANKSEIEDTEAKIDILKAAVKKKQPQEDIRLAKQKTKRKKQLKKFIGTSEYKLIQQFAKNNLGHDNKVELLKLQVLLESKGWDITSDELVNLVKKESSKLHQVKLAKFVSSVDYKLIEHFASENPKGENTADLTKLLLLLENKGWKITSDELMNLVEIETNKQRLDNARSKILMSNPENRDEILKSYLSCFQPNDFELRALEGILEEKNLSFPDLDDLFNALDKMKAEIEQLRQNPSDGNKSGNLKLEFNL